MHGDHLLKGQINKMITLEALWVSNSSQPATILTFLLLLCVCVPNVPSYWFVNIQQILKRKKEKYLLLFFFSIELKKCIIQSYREIFCILFHIKHSTVLSATMRHQPAWHHILLIQRLHTHSRHRCACLLSFLVFHI